MPSETFDFTGGWQRFNVPAGVTSVSVTVKGAGSGVHAGGLVTGDLAVQGGQQLWIQVGREGKLRSGKNGGGDSYGGGARGGDGRGDGQGGNGGGGASAIRLGDFNGAIKAVAGGAGGNSGDGGAGGQGGGNNGEDGHRGAGGGSTRNATGGTQSGGGKGGAVLPQNANGWYVGQDAPDQRLTQGGVGASPDRPQADGGGGGGGGYYGGGGGNGSKPGHAGGGGGGGGSNYHAPLTNGAATRGDGSTTNGQVRIAWVTPIPAGQPPPPPTDMKVNGQDLGDETPTRALTSATITALLSESSDRSVRLLVRYSTDHLFGVYGTLSTFSTAPGVVHTVVLNVLQPNTLYYVRAWSIDDEGLLSTTYNSGSFWTDRPPNPPTLTAPGDNTSFLPTDNITFTFDPTDPDDPDPAAGWEFRWRPIPLPGKPPNPWSPVVPGRGDDGTVTIDAGTFRGNTFYEWTARSRDSNGLWGDWAFTRSFYIIAVTTPPTLTSPIRGAGVVAAELVPFTWRFADPTTDAVQVRADIQYRVVGTEDWIILYGDPDPGQPGSMQEWLIPPGTFIPGYHYEWQARTENAGALVSEWSTTEDFWPIETPGTGREPTIGTDDRSIQPPLGCGINRVFIYERGGLVRRGEITPIATLQYGRKRDDISVCLLSTNGFGSDCGELLKTLRCWQHEVVIFRDGKRVWEGPVVRITDSQGGLEIEAKDVMNYVYRRVLRQGYNDTFRKVNGVDVGGMAVTRRASLITMNALAYDDPNVLKWMTGVFHSDDAKQHRAVADYTRTAWEEIDDMAATAGLDYTVTGRRILYWDTHRPLGRLPEMRDGDFSDPPVVTEYGMQVANHFAVTNGSGIYGTAERGIETVDTGHGPQQVPLYYGWLEMLASAYGETVGAEPDTLTAAARASLEQTLTDQADRNIAHRWPTPVVVRVPDNSFLNPDLGIGFDQLVPGVWIPVRASGTVREIAQWQKLDSVTVTQNGQEGEKIAVVMSPAPNFGMDPDADAAAEED